MSSRYELTISNRTKIFNFFRKLIILTGFDRVLARFTRNRAVSSFIAKLIPPPYLYSDNIKRKVLVKGICYFLYMADTMDHGVYYGLEGKALNLVFNKVKREMYIMDIGANLGYTTMKFAQLTGPKGNVYAFEPDVFNFSKAQKNLSLNSFSNIDLHNEGMGDYTCEAILYNVNKNNRGMMRILDENKSNDEFEKSNIKLTTIDNAMEQYNINRIDLIKIDVEGFEQKVLTGAKRTLNKFKPFLFIEIDDNNLKEHGDSVGSLIENLQSYGYLVKNAITESIIESHDNFDKCHFDIICYAMQHNDN